MSYTIAVKPHQKPGKVTATSSDGHSFTAETPLLTGARYWLNQGADPTATITTIWSSGPGHWSLRSTIGQAASLIVEEGDRQPYFRKWKPHPLAVARKAEETAALASHSPQNETEAPTLAPSS